MRNQVGDRLLGRRNNPWNLVHRTADALQLLFTGTRGVRIKFDQVLTHVDAFRVFIEFRTTSAAQIVGRLESPSMRIPRFD